jgi:hypothetical protein
MEFEIGEAAPARNLTALIDRLGVAPGRARERPEVGHRAVLPQEGVSLPGGRGAATDNLYPAVHGAYDA